MKPLLFLIFLISLIGVGNLQAMRRTTALRPTQNLSIPHISNGIGFSSKRPNKTWHSSSLFQVTTQDDVKSLIDVKEIAAALKITKNYNKNCNPKMPLFDKEETEKILRDLNSKAFKRQIKINSLIPAFCKKLSFVPFFNGLLSYHPVVAAIYEIHPLAATPMACASLAGIWGWGQYARQAYHQHQLNEIVDLQKELSSAQETKEVAVQ